LLSSVASAGETSVVYQVVNLEPEVGEAFAVVCAQKFTLAGGGPAVVREPAVGSETLELSLVGLSRRGPGTILVDATLKDSAGAPVHHAQLEAASLEDAPAVCERLGIALVTRSTPEEFRSRRNITRAEARASRSPARLGTEKVLGLQVRVLAPLARGYETRPAMSLGFDGRFERERYFIEVGAGFIVPSTLIGSSSNSTVSVGGIFLNGGVSFYLTDGDIAPYAGLGIEPRIVFSSSPIALAPYVQVGVMLWRQSSTRLYAELRVAQNVLPVSPDGRQAVYPTELGLGVGIGW
jgi:hypothetical protein